MAPTLRRGAAGPGTRDDAVRVLRSNLLVAIQDLRDPIVVVTSAQPGEGTTSTTVALARSLASAGTRVALVDLDLRAPGVHQRLGVPGVPGVADVLDGDRDVDACLQRLTVPDAAPGAAPLSFLPAGTTTANPTELLARPAVGALLRRLAAAADVVLVDAPAVLPTADTLVIGRLATGAILVVEARRTSAQTANRAKAALIRNQTRILGVVLNQVRPSDDDAASALGYEARDGAS